MLKDILKVRMDKVRVWSFCQCSLPYMDAILLLHLGVAPQVASDRDDLIQLCHINLDGVPHIAMRQVQLLIIEEVHLLMQKDQ